MFIDSLFFYRSFVVPCSRKPPIGNYSKKKGMRLVRLTAMPPNDFSACTHARKRLQKYKEILDLQKKIFFPLSTPALHQPYYSPTPTESGRTQYFFLLFSVINQFYAAANIQQHLQRYGSFRFATRGLPTGSWCRELPASYAVGGA